LFKGGSLPLLSLSRLNIRPRRCDEPLKSCSTDLQKAGIKAGILKKRFLFGLIFCFVSRCYLNFRGSDLRTMLPAQARSLHWLAGFLYCEKPQTKQSITLPLNGGKSSCP
jgi:hypothetical protein